MARVAPDLPPPTMVERAAAARAARALRAAIADPITMGERQVMHVDLSRPRRGLWITTWSHLPGFRRTNGPGRTAATTRYDHDCLPGWEYARDELLVEMIPDLDALAERGTRPTEATGTEKPLPLFVPLASRDMDRAGDRL